MLLNSELTSKGFYLIYQLLLFIAFLDLNVRVNNESVYVR